MNDNVVNFNGPRVEPTDADFDQLFADAEKLRAALQDRKVRGFACVWIVKEGSEDISRTSRFGLPGMTMTELIGAVEEMKHDMLRERFSED